jgi:hypothetical protein
MEDIIAYSIIAIIPLAVIVGAILLRRRFVRSRAAKIKLRQEQAESMAKQNREEAELMARLAKLTAKQSQEPEPQHRKNQTGPQVVGGAGGVVGKQEYDFHTRTVRTSVYDPKTNSTKYVTTPAAQNIAPGTVLPQAVDNSGPDLLTIMALAGLASSFGSTPAPAHSKPTADFGLDDSDSRKSSSSSFGSSDSSSSWSDSSSSDSGPSSDW